MNAIKKTEDEDPPLKIAEEQYKKFDSCSHELLNGCCPKFDIKSLMELLMGRSRPKLHKSSKYAPVKRDESTRRKGASSEPEGIPKIRCDKKGEVREGL